MRKIFIMIITILMFTLTGCGGGGGGNSAENNSQPAENTTPAETPAVAENKPVEQAAPAENKPVAEAKPQAKKDVKGNLKITMLNAGQGDAFLVQTSKQNILIDTSDTDEREKLIAELEKTGVTTFDKIILTHPHADHIGGLEKLLKDNKYTVKEVCDNGIASTSKLYTGYMKLLKQQKIKHTSLKVGDVLDFGDGVKFNVLYPTKDLVDAVNNGNKKTDPNNESVVGRLVYNNFSMMFTGDAEKEVESNIWADNDAKNLRCNILKAGHHGSYTASTENFVKTVNPEYVLISAGEPTDKRGGNTYGHPHKEPLENYLANGIPAKNIFWSWKNGTVIITSDGKNFSVKPEVEEDWVEKWLAEKKKSAKK